MRVAPERSTGDAGSIRLACLAYLQRLCQCFVQAFCRHNSENQRIVFLWSERVFFTFPLETVLEVVDGNAEIVKSLGDRHIQYLLDQYKLGVRSVVLFRLMQSLCLCQGVPYIKFQVTVLKFIAHNRDLRGTLALHLGGFDKVALPASALGRSLLSGEWVGRDYGAGRACAPGRRGRVWRGGTSPILFGSPDQVGRRIITGAAAAAALMNLSPDELRFQAALLDTFTSCLFDCSVSMANWVQFGAKTPQLIGCARAQPHARAAARALSRTHACTRRQVGRAHLLDPHADVHPRGIPPIRRDRASADGSARGGVPALANHARATARHPRAVL
jgi:hypothetical protein